MSPPIIHGQAGRRGTCTRLYAMWAAIKYRCCTPTAHNYRLYGGRGIMLCDEWHDFQTFANAVGDHPGPGWSLDRIDNDGHYEPGNVRWADAATQTQNRDCVKLDADKVSEIRMLYATGHFKQKELAAIYGVDQSAISHVIRRKRWGNI